MILKEAKTLKVGDKFIVKGYPQIFIIKLIDDTNPKRMRIWTDSGRLFCHKDIEKVLN